MRADTVTKDFISDANVFSDVFNYYIYGGQQVIRPEQLTPQDSVKIALPYGADGKTVPIQRFRDAQKLYTAMTDGEVEYVLYGIESQEEIHYAMPVKNNLYDALDYVVQVEKTGKAHREAMKREREEREAGETEENVSLKKPNSGEFLGGFWKEDKLMPSVTVTIYFGSDQWDGPLNLFEMIEVEDPKLFSFMDNYQVRLIAPALMTDEEIMKFQTNLREVLLFIKYSKDKEKLRDILIMNEKRFREVERGAADVIKVITNSGLKYDEKELKIDVCQAIKEMREESQKEGEDIGVLKKAQEDARNFYRLGVKLEIIAEGVGYDLGTVKTWLGLSVE